jgi:hypothetical protein
MVTDEVMGGFYGESVKANSFHTHCILTELYPYRIFSQTNSVCLMSGLKNIFDNFLAWQVKTELRARLFRI